MNLVGVLRRLEAAIHKHGTVASFAESIGVTASYVVAVRRNRKPPGVKILDAIGVEEAGMSYRLKPNGEDHGREVEDGRRRRYEDF